ncbi:putative DNA glycosylase At3g47830 isoform X1 [Jatropha curcas]|uniref:putative DNA glycosylase At3g47830 isoform X1 n=1 Tax=Jatropha curcas TaxID=180498 RepID=UPI0009D6FC2C|nr:putative DNA glycosylase At3g47830 isoform X1 [Jatropha curcas]
MPAYPQESKTKYIMQKNRKRKQQKPAETETEAKSAKIINGIKQDPYPTHSRPTPEECRTIRDSLLALHGFPQEFAKYRKQRQDCSIQIDCDAHCGVKSEPEESVLDGLIKTVLSQNTTEVNSLRAFANLKSAFPTWEDVLAAEFKCIENAIRCGGLAPTKASCIKNILSCLIERKGKLCLEYLRDLSVDEIKAELSNFKGIGPKTVSCVLLFQLQQDDFPVDTHVFDIAKAIGWVPEVADRNKTYLHLNQRIPNELKFDLNCLLFTHGKLCRRCTKKGGGRQRKESRDNSCPLLNYCDNSSVKTINEVN